MCIYYPEWDRDRNRNRNRDRNFDRDDERDIKEVLEDNVAKTVVVTTDAGENFKGIVSTVNGNVLRLVVEYHRNGNRRTRNYSRDYDEFNSMGYVAAIPIRHIASVVMHTI